MNEMCCMGEPSLLKMLRSDVLISCTWLMYCAVKPHVFIFLWQVMLRSQSLHNYVYLNHFCTVIDDGLHCWGTLGRLCALQF